MSDTPLTDAHVISNATPYVHAEAARGIEMQLREEIQRLQRELTEAQHRIRTLIQERDSARIQADHKWRLLEEFEALLGTSDVDTGVERVKEAQRGKARYEYVRKLHPFDFRELYKDCLFHDLKFDSEVDRRRNAQ